MHSVALHLQSSFNDEAFISAFKRAGFNVRSLTMLADAVAVLDMLAMTNQLVIAIAPAHHGGIALLELLIELSILSRIKVVLIDYENDARTAIRALRLGASDYFTSGMSQQEIQARIQTLLASHAIAPALVCEASEDASNPPEWAEMELDAPAPLPENISINVKLRAIRRGDMWISLSPIEWRLFEELIHNRGRVVQFGELVRRGLNRERVTPSETSLLRLHMSRLRAKLNAHFDRELNIITLRGRGYMLA